MCQGRTTSCFFPAPQTLFSSSPLPPNPAPHPTPLKIQKLTREEMVECQLKGLFYNFDEKYFSGAQVYGT
jgi:hypothetical protein